MRRRPPARSACRKGGAAGTVGSPAPSRPTPAGRARQTRPTLSGGASRETVSAAGRGRPPKRKAHQPPQQSAPYAPAGRHGAAKPRSHAARRSCQAARPAHPARAAPPARHTAPFPKGLPTMRGRRLVRRRRCRTGRSASARRSRGAGPAAPRFAKATLPFGSLDGAGSGASHRTGPYPPAPSTPLPGDRLLTPHAVRPGGARGRPRLLRPGPGRPRGAQSRRGAGRRRRRRRGCGVTPDGATALHRPRTAPPSRRWRIPCGFGGGGAGSAGSRTPAAARQAGPGESRPSRRSGR